MPLGVPLGWAEQRRDLPGDKAGVVSGLSVKSRCVSISVLSEGAVVRLVRNKRQEDWYSLWSGADQSRHTAWDAGVGPAIQQQVNEYWMTLNSLTDSYLDIDSSPIQQAIETAQSYVHVALESLRNSRYPFSAPPIDE
ncbi:unnamed protein product [Lampetra fluviatilis]